MSTGGLDRREVAYRVFAAEFEQADFAYSESDEERAPNYVVTPTGARVNRLFAIGVLTEVEEVNPEMVRGRVVDPTGAFVTYAGQYQPDELAFLERADPPAFVALAGKARTFEPEDDDRVFTSIRPESISEVDAEARDRWVVTTAKRTLDRVGIVASAITAGLTGDQLRTALLDADVDDRLADGIALALDYYETTPVYLDAIRSMAIDAVRVVAGDQDEVEPITVPPAAATASDTEAETADSETLARELATLDLTAPSPVETDEPSDDATTKPDAAPATTASAEASTDTQTPESSTTATDAVETDDSPSDRASTDASSSSADTPDMPSPESSDATAASTDTADATDTETADSAATESSEPNPSTDDPGSFELDDAARQEVEDEYGTEFSTADQVDSPTDEPDSATTEAATDSDAGQVPDDDSDTDTPPEREVDIAPADESNEAATDVDLADAVIRVMDDLDEGDGASYDAVVETVADEYGEAPDEVETAIEDALMSGRCYEPSDNRLKSI